MTVPSMCLSGKQHVVHDYTKNVLHESLWWDFDRVTFRKTTPVNNFDAMVLKQLVTSNTNHGWISNRSTAATSFNSNSLNNKAYQANEETLKYVQLT